MLVIFDEHTTEFLDTRRMSWNACETDEMLSSCGLSRKFKAWQVCHGYGLASRQIAEVLQKTRQPFNVNAIAQAGALAGIQDEEHMRRTRELTHGGRDFLQSELSAMNLEFVPSAVTRVCARGGDKVFQAFCRGVIIRAMRSY